MNRTEVLGDPVEDWTARPHPLDSLTFQQLQGNYCELKTLNSKTDPIVIEELFQVFKPTEDEHFKYLGYGPFKTSEEFFDFVKDKEEPEKNIVLYTIFVDRKPVGFISYLRISPNQGTIEIGHLNFSEKLIRTRAATEAVYLLLSLAFDRLGYRRVEWKCNAHNVKSRRAARRFGFQYEGTWLKSQVMKSRSRDDSWYSIVDDEWANIKDKFLIWLNPNNFDNEGHQLSKLDAIHAGQLPRQLEDI